MTKQEALEWIRALQIGVGIDYNPDIVPEGEIAKGLRNDGKFRYGMEYGVIYALMLAFGISKEEL